MALDFYCRCLNIRIHIDEGSILESWENHADDVTKSDPFFTDAVLVITPKGVEIQKKLRCLSHERTNETWKINVCLNCDMETHAFSVKDECKLCKIFVSTTMQHNALAANLASSTKSFSPLYEVLIPPQPKEHSASCLPLLPRSQLHSQIAELKAHTIRRLNAENEFLLERIRKFENEQMSLFNELQVQAQRDQNTLTQMLINHYSEDDNGSRKPSDENIDDAKARDSKMQKIQPVTISAGPPKSPRVSPVLKSRILPIHDSIFVMDDEETEEVEMESSLHDDSEIEDKVSDLNLDDEAFMEKPEDSFKLYASSLPIAISSHWKSSSRGQEQDNLGGLDRNKMDDPTWIAASIQALTMSVCGNDGTEMFGARPRPRLNTLD